MSAVLMRRHAKSGGDSAGRCSLASQHWSCNGTSGKVTYYCRMTPASMLRGSPATERFHIPGRRRPASQSVLSEPSRDRSESWARRWGWHLGKWSGSRGTSGSHTTVRSQPRPNPERIRLPGPDWERLSAADRLTVAGASSGAGHRSLYRGWTGTERRLFERIQADCHIRPVAPPVSKVSEWAGSCERW